MRGDEVIEVPVDGGKLAVYLSGAGPPVVLCHGGPGLWDYMGSYAELCPPGLSVYRFDQRGCGRSRCGSPYTLAQALDDLAALLGHLRLGTPVIGGHSWGAELALAFTVTHPERVRGLLYVSGIGISPEWRKEFQVRRERCLSRESRSKLEEIKASFVATNDPERRRRLTRAYARLAWPCDFADPAFGRLQIPRLFREDSVWNLEGGQALAADAEPRVVGEAFERKLRALSTPTLVVHGAEDPRPAFSARRLAEALPRGRYIELEGVGHHPGLEAPQRMQDVLKEFLMGLGS